MKKIILLGSLLLTACMGAKQAQEIAIIPAPVHLEQGSGSFKLTPRTVVVNNAADSQTTAAAATLARELGRVVGATLQIGESGDKGTIVLQPMTGPAHPEGYELTVTPKQITIGANDYNGAFYALQTLLQLLPAEAFNPVAQAKAYRIPAVTIHDYPRFGWRGMHLDVSRHFSSVEFVKRYIDLLAMHKLNRFHWHLTNDQGWRIEIKKYPKLTEIGAWRIDRESEGWSGYSAPKPGEKPTYGGFYTQDEIRDVVAYARQRGVSIVPEIEVPGHSSAVFAAYPQLSCLGTEQLVPSGGHYPPELATVYCAGNEEAFAFLEDVLDEVIGLFPDAPYIHIGGDEVDKTFWKNCPKCKARMRAEGLKNTDELQSYFIKRVEAYVNSKGKPIIGWDEILEGGVAPNATVMSWRGTGGGIEAARQGHDVVMTPDSYLYFDYYQNNPEVEPRAIGGFVTTKHVYSFEPIPDALTPEQGKHILGAQANLWREYISSDQHIEYMVLPRMSALAEVDWSPREARNWDDFNRRLEVQYKRFRAMGVNFHPGADQIEFSPSYDSVNKVFSVALSTEFHNGVMHYTTDGSTPTLQSPVYENPLQIKESTTVKVIVAKNGVQISKSVSERHIGMHKGVGKKLTYNKQPAEAYPGSGPSTLVDGLTGSTRYKDPLLQGFNNEDFDVVIDLGTKEPFSKVIGSFLQSAGAWIYLPAEMVVSVSDDGKHFSEIGRVPAGEGTDPREHPTIRRSLTVAGSFSGRYVRIVGVNPVTPAGLPGAGTRNWIFADEIFID